MRERKCKYESHNKLQTKKMIERKRKGVRDTEEGEGRGQSLNS